MNECTLDYDDIPLDESGSPLLSPIHSFFDVARQLEELYITYRGRFVMMTKNGGVFVPQYKDPNTGKIVDKKITNSVVCGHLNGYYSICVYAGSASSKFVCFDVDDGKIQTVKMIVDILSDIGFPRDRIYVSTSGGKGFHVEMFFSSIMFTSDLRKIYDYVCATGGLDTAKVEFRPTSGESIKLPLSIHRKTGNTCWYMDKDTMKPIQNPEYIMEIEQIPRELALEIVKRIPVCVPVKEENAHTVSGRVLTSEEMEAFNGDYYPDLTEQGKRNALMVQIAVHNRYRGLDKDTCRDKLVQWYHRQNPAFINSTEKFVEAELEKILDWVYGDKFVIENRSREITFYKSDIRMIFAQKKRSERLVLFLIQYYTKLHGSCCLKSELMAERVGLTKPTVLRVLHTLEKEKWIDTIHSHPKNIGGKYKQFANRYQISVKAQSWSVSEKNLQDIFSIHMNRDEYKIDPDDDLVKSYHKALTSFISDRNLRKLLTKKEYKEIQEND